MHGLEEFWVLRCWVAFGRRCVMSWEWAGTFPGEQPASLHMEWFGLAQGCPLPALQGKEEGSKLS